MLMRNRWLLSIVLCVTLSVTMLWTPAFASAADNSGGQQEAETYLNSDGTQVHVSKDGFVYRYIGYKNGRDYSASYDTEGKIPEGDVAVRIIGYCGTGTEVNIPDQIDGYDVTEVLWNKERPSRMDGEIDYDSITKVNIPKTVKRYKCLFSKSMKVFEVAEGNENYYSEDGMLVKKWSDRYTNDNGEEIEEVYKALVEYPQGKGEKSIVIPDGVTQFDLELFEKTGVEELTIPASVSYIGFASDLEIPSLREINVNEGNEFYYSKDGVLFKTDKWSNWEYDPDTEEEKEVEYINNTLIYYPVGKEDETYTVPEGTDYIEVYFTNNYKVKKVVIPESVGYLWMDIFDNSSVETVEFNGEYAPSAYCSDEAFQEKHIKVIPETGNGYDRIAAIATGKNNYWTKTFFTNYGTMKTGYPFEYYAKFEAAKGEVKYKFAKYAEDENGNVDYDAALGEATNTFPTEPGWYQMVAYVEDADSYIGIRSEYYDFKLEAGDDEDASANNVRFYVDENDPYACFSYDGKPHGIEAVAKHGTPTVYYAPMELKETEDGEDYVISGEYTTEMPKDAGYYSVKAVVEKTDEYDGAEAGDIIEITKEDNEWIENISCADIEYGQKPAPHAGSLFGTVSYVYSDNYHGDYNSIAPTDAGTYFVKALVDGGTNYRDLESSPYRFKISKKDNEWTQALGCPDVCVGEKPAPKAAAKFGDVKYYYSDEANGEYKETAPTALGDHYVKAAVEASNNYTGLVSDPVKFTITKKKNEWTKELECADINVGETLAPSAAAKFGEVEYLYSDEADGRYVKDAPTAAGEHYIKAEVKEGAEYTALESAPVKFAIKKLTNEWTEELTCADINAGETPHPKAVAKHGNVKYLYSDNEGGQYTDTVPTAAGEHYVKAVVEEDDEYAALESTPVRFTIIKAEVPKADNAWTKTLTCASIKVGEKPAPSAKAKYGTVVYLYSSSSAGKYTGTVPTKAGTYYVKAVVKAATGYSGLESAPVKFTIAKKANTLKVVFKNKTLKAKKLRKKAFVYKAVKVKYAKGAVVYTAKPVNKKSKKVLKFNKKTGKIKIKKKAKKGVYKMRITVKAKGNAQYKASKTFKKTIKIRVK